MIRLSEKGFALITSFEGYLTKQPDGSCKAYCCPAGVWTCGWGCTEGVNEHTHWTEAEARAAFGRELEKHARIVERLVKVDISQGQTDALISFSYNCGGLAGSTLLKKVNAEDWTGAAAEFDHWTKAHTAKGFIVLPGLVRRRKAEAALFLSDLDGAEHMPQAAAEHRPIDRDKLVVGAGTVAAVASGSATHVTHSVGDPVEKAQAAVDKVKQAKQVASEAKTLVPLHVRPKTIPAEYYGAGMLVALAVSAMALVVHFKRG